MKECNFENKKSADERKDPGRTEKGNMAEINISVYIYVKKVKLTDGRVKGRDRRWKGVECGQRCVFYGKSGAYGEEGKGNMGEINLRVCIYIKSQAHGWKG